jgi:hypothetical protein
VGGAQRAEVRVVSERTIWIVRLVGIVLFLVLMYLLMSLYAELVKMNEDRGARGGARGEDRGAETRVAGMETTSRSVLSPYPQPSPHDDDAIPEYPAQQVAE